MTTQRAVANFMPSIALVQRDDGRWTMEVDWSGSFTGYTTGDGRELDPDSPEALAACATVDAWVGKQPPTVILPPAATYHGIVKAECRQCGYTATDVTTLEVWNDLTGPCPSCDYEDGETAWTMIDRTVVTIQYIDGEEAGRVTTCEACGNPTDRPLAVDDCPNFHRHN